MRTLIAVLLLAAPLARAADKSGDKVIYGADNRYDYYQVSPDLRKLADSVVSLWKAGDVSPDQGGGFRLATRNYGEAMRLCPKEPFRSQPIGAFCSGSLVGPNLVMTAGHCIKDESDCAGTRFVFGFALKSAGVSPSTAAASDVYSCRKIIKRYLRDQDSDGGPGLGPDYALVELDRPVEGRSPLPVNRDGGVSGGDAVFVIGHPSGLPLKVAAGAKVRDASPQGYFVADLDTYGGNSGSAVFNGRTGLIEGILVRGDNDFVYKDGCRVSNVVAQDAGRGEDVTKVSELLSAIPDPAVRLAAPAKQADVSALKTLGTVDPALFGK